MPLLEKDNFVADRWIMLDQTSALPESGSVIIPFTRFKAEWDSLSSFPGELGISLANTDEIEDLSLFLPHIALILLPFPSFADGRAYSLAHQIRSAGYRGDLRAAGNVLPDQLQMMLQVGFTSFDVNERFPLAVWRKAARQMSLAYQRGLYRPAGEREVWTERHHEAAPWEEQPHAG